MSVDTNERRSGGATARLRALVVGDGEYRLRAVWRVLLAWPVLWFLAGSAGVAVAGVLVPAGASRPATMLAFGLFQAGFFAAALVGWARYVDSRPLADYGTSVSGPWVADLFAGFCAVVVGQAAWLALGSSLGWASVEVSLAAPQGSFAVGLVAVLAAVAVNVWVQESVFVAVTVRNAAEGLSARGLTPARAVLAGWLVAVALFALKHRPSEPEVVLNLLLALGVFALLYVHTGELALSVGVHTAVNAAGWGLFVPASVAPERPSVFAVTTSLSGLPRSLSDGAIPQILVAYLLLLGWIRWRRGDVSIATDLARWNER